MCSKYNEKTKEGLSREVKRLQERCLDTCNIIENSSLDQNISADNIGQLAFRYVEALRTQIEKSDTTVPTDENLIACQFLAEMKTKTEEVDKLIAFTLGSITDVENEILRLNSHIKIAEEALAKPRIKTRDITPQRLEKAKENFRILKKELNNLIQSMFRNNSDLVLDITGQLMRERLSEESEGYIPVTDEYFRIMELLKDLNIVSEHPYNKMEVKLAY